MIATCVEFVLHGTPLLRNLGTIYINYIFVS